MSQLNSSFYSLRLINLIIDFFSFDFRGKIIARCKCSDSLTPCLWSSEHAKKNGEGRPKIRFKSRDDEAKEGCCEEDPGRNTPFDVSIERSADQRHTHRNHSNTGHQELV